MKSESNLSIISVLALYIFILNLHRKANQESIFFETSGLIQKRKVLCPCDLSGRYHIRKKQMVDSEERIKEHNQKVQDFFSLYPPLCHAMPLYAEANHKDPPGLSSLGCCFGIGLHPKLDVYLLFASSQWLILGILLK